MQRRSIQKAVAIVILVTILSYILVINKSPIIQSLAWNLKEEVRDLCPARNGLIPNTSEIERLSEKTLRTNYRDYGSNNEIICKVMLRMGNLGDGGWEVCDDEPVRPKHDCLVYSFGINYDFSFDDMIAKHYGCEVHAFDPSMNMADSRRNEKVTFHRLGVYGSNTVIHGNWPVKTIAEIRRMLGHTNRRIDVMKMDVEGSEWPTLDTALKDDSLNNVTQLLLEIHNFKNLNLSLASILKVLHRLRDRGFRVFYAHKNPLSTIIDKTEIPHWVNCYELHMIYLPACHVK